MAATRMPFALCRMCGRILPGGISPSTPWHTAPRKGSSTPLAGGTTLPPILCGRWGSRNAALRRTRCASCGSTGSRPGSLAIDPATGAAARVLGPHLDCVSAERIQEELLKLLAAPGPEAIWNPPFWRCPAGAGTGRTAGTVCGTLPYHRPDRTNSGECARPAGGPSLPAG